MGGCFAVAAKADCSLDVFYGTDYHNHLGTMRGGMAVVQDRQINRVIHDITNAPFRSKFDADLQHLKGSLGIGVISDYDDQPLLIGSHLGSYAIVTVGKINNLQELAAEAFQKRSAHFTEMTGCEINPTELVASLVNEQDDLASGLAYAQSRIDGSCTILLMTADAIYAARDYYGRTPLVLGRKEGAWAVTMETCAFPNLDFETVRDLGPGEIIQITAEGVAVLREAQAKSRVCSFFWVYFGYPSSSYEGINAEASRYRNGAHMARRESVEVDMVGGVPDSGTAHAIGYAQEAKLPFTRPFVKYTPTWPRSFMPQNQGSRDLVAKMKLLPVAELIEGQRLLLCDDSIVRGTQLRDTVKRLFESGAREVHVRAACPPLNFGCKFLNFSRSKSILDLAARRAVKQLEGTEDADLTPYIDPDTPQYKAMVEIIREELNLTSLGFQRLDDLVAAIGLPKERLCTYCWDGCGDEGCPKG